MYFKLNRHKIIKIVVELCVFYLPYYSYYDSITTVNYTVGGGNTLSQNNLQISKYSITEIIHLLLRSIVCAEQFTI